MQERKKPCGGPSGPGKKEERRGETEAARGSIVGHSAGTDGATGASYPNPIPAILGLVDHTRWGSRDLVRIYTV